MTHIDSISCGQGAPSLFLIVLAGEKKFHADMAICADTGWERECHWNNGRVTTNKVFFEEVTKPLAESCGLKVSFVRSPKDSGEEYLPIDQHIIESRKLAGQDGHGEFYNVNIPMFGSNGGRLSQSCTDKWKIQAIHQELRRNGAKSATCALGLHLDEIHRLKPSKNKWTRFRWPLVDAYETENNGLGDMGLGKKYRRFEIYEQMEKRGIPYLITTECDGCPHKDLARWKRNSPEKIQELEKLESKFGGSMFLTKERIPLSQAIEKMKQDNSDDICDSEFCFL